MLRTSLLQQAWYDFLTAMQFLTRVRVPSPPYDDDSLSRAVKFFPVVGLLVGGSAALVNRLLAPHLSRLATALLIVTFLVLITGCFHEDALADSADAFGGGWSREQILVIMKDSRIGSYGGAALALGLLSRVVLLASLPSGQIPHYLIAAHVLCRWTTLPLSYYLRPARTQQEDANASQGARIARLTTRGTLIGGSAFSLAVAIIMLGIHAATAVAIAILISFVSGAYYKRRIGGVTGDCFGATNQLTEVAVYLTGAWIA